MEGSLSERLDENKVEQLRVWGAGLSKDGNDEVRAMGKAILLLIDEIERLHVDLWNARAMVRDDVQEPVDGEVPSDGSVEKTLRARLRHLAGRRASPEAD